MILILSEIEHKRLPRFLQVLSNTQQQAVPRFFQVFTKIQYHGRQDSFKSFGRYLEHLLRWWINIRNPQDSYKIKAPNSLTIFSISFKDKRPRVSKILSDSSKNRTTGDPQGFFTYSRTENQRPSRLFQK